MGLDLEIIETDVEELRDYFSEEWARVIAFQHVPELIAEVRRLREQVERLVEGKMGEDY